MAKCGHDICPDDNCGWKHLLSKKRRENCRRVQRCFEESCSNLKALGPSGFALYDVCLGHCHRSSNDPKWPSRYPTPDEYLCANFDPVALVDYFGVTICAIPDGKETANDKVKKAAEASNSQTRNALIFIGAIILVLIVIVWNNRG